jgi:hypothetical protein
MFKEIKVRLSLKRVSASIGLVGLVVISLAQPIAAQSVTQGYKSDSLLQRGTTVSLDAEDSSLVVAVTKENEARIHGVVVASNDSSFTLSEQEEQTFVATVGRFEALVSTEGGIIQQGDFLTVSSISGIMKKAAEIDRYTIGKAIESFTGEQDIISVTSLSDTAGKENPVTIGRIVVDLNVGSNPLLRPAATNLPEFLKNSTDLISGKEVSPVRIYVGLFILLAASSVSATLLYSGIKSSIISIGRNPLSKKSITKSLLQIIFTAIIIFLMGIFGVYLLLRL